MMLPQGIEFPMERLAGVCQRYGVKSMAVFGSAARGEMGPESDVDVVVEFKTGVRLGLEYYELEAELGEIFGRRVDLATRKWLRPGVRGKVEREAVTIYAA